MSNNSLDTGNGLLTHSELLSSDKDGAGVGKFFEDAYSSTKAFVKEHQTAEVVAAVGLAAVAAYKYRGQIGKLITGTEGEVLAGSVESRIGGKAGADLLKPATIHEDALRQIFDQRQMTTPAQYWMLPGEAASFRGTSTAPHLPTVFVKGDVHLQIGSTVKHFPDGAYVYSRDGQLGTFAAKDAWGGGITAEAGGPIVPTVTEFGGYKKGNIATLELGKDTGRLSLTMPEHKGYGFSFLYNAPQADQLIAAAKAQGKIVELTTGSGKPLTGFFAKGDGGIYPENISSSMLPTDFKNGEFLAILTKPGRQGEKQWLFPYRNYSAEQVKSFGSMPENSVTLLRTLDGKAVVPKSLPALDIKKVPTFLH